MPSRNIGVYTITNGGSGTRTAGVTGVVGNYVDPSLQGTTASDVQVGDYVATSLPDQSSWRWKVANITNTSPLTLDLIFDDDGTNFPAVFESNPIISGDSVIAGFLLTPDHSMIPSFETYGIPAILMTALIIANDTENSIAGSLATNIPPASDDSVGLVGITTLASREDHKHPAQGVSSDSQNILSIGSDGLHMGDVDNMLSTDTPNSLKKGTDGKLLWSGAVSLTQAEIDALSGLTGGELVFNSDTQKFSYYSGVQSGGTSVQYNSLLGAGSTGLNASTTERIQSMPAQPFDVQFSSIDLDNASITGVALTSRLRIFDNATGTGTVLGTAFATVTDLTAASDWDTYTFGPPLVIPAGTAWSMGILKTAGVGTLTVAVVADYIAGGADLTIGGDWKMQIILNEVPTPSGVPDNTWIEL